MDDDDGLWSSLGLIGAKAQCSIGLDDERGGGAENDDPQPNSSSSRHNQKVAVAPTTDGLATMVFGIRSQNPLRK